MLNKRILAEMKRLEKTVDKEQRKEIRKLGKKIKQSHNTIDKELIKLFKKYERDGVLNYSQLVFDGSQIGLEHVIILEGIKMYAEIQRTTYRALQRVADETVQTMKNIEGVPAIQKEIPTEHIINKDMAGLNWVTRQGMSRDKFIAKLQKDMRKGLEKGTTYSDMSRQLAADMGTELYKAERIIRTEGHRVMNDTKLQSFQEINQRLPIEKRWLSMGDERVRDGHVDMDGVTIPITEEFESPLGGRGLAPGLMNNAADDIGCRCIMVMEIPKGVQLEDK